MAWEAPWEKHLICISSLAVSGVAEVLCQQMWSQVWNLPEGESCLSCAMCLSEESSVEVLNVFKWSELQMTRMTVLFHELLFQAMQWFLGLGTA